MEITIILLLILFNGLFAMSEVALISARKSSLGAKAKAGNKAAQRALKMASEPDKFLSTVQIGITLIGILTGIYSGEALAAPFAKVLIGWGVPLSIAFSVAQVTIIVVVTYLTIVFGELMPKRIGLATAERIAMIVARPMQFVATVASPFVWLLSRSINYLSRLFHLENAGSKVTEEEIRSIIQEGADDGEVREVEQEIVGRVFSLGDRNVASIMTHRSDIVWLKSSMDAAQIREIVARTPHSLYPFARKSIDHIEGIVHLKELFVHMNEPEFALEKIMCPVKFFHETTDVYGALEQLRAQRLTYGIVSDEFGVTQGIVTLKDILDALVGELPETREEPDIVERQDGSHLIDGQCPFYDFLVYFDMEEVCASNQYNTLSGLILHKLGHIPATGETLQWLSFRFEIVDMDGARIDKILVTK